LHDTKIQKEIGEKSGKKSAKKVEKEEEDRVQAVYSWRITKHVWVRTKSRRIKQDYERTNNKHDVLSDDNEEINNVHLEEEIYQ